MKKFLRTGKKALSVFMAVMMVLTAWVFFEPMEAEAATAGSYYVVIKWTPTNKGGTSNEYYTGKSSISTSSNKNNCMGISLFYKTNNGTGSTGEVYWDIGHSNVPCGQAQGSGATVTASTGWTDSTEGTQLRCVATVPGFPTEVFAICDYAAATKCVWQLDSIQVGKSSSSLTTLWSGKVGLDSSWNRYDATINSSGVSGNINAGNSTSSNNWSSSYPYVNSVSFISGSNSITIPKTGESDVSTTYTAGVYDQYGVRMTYEPTYYVRSSAPTSAQASSSTITGVTMSNGTLTVTSDAQMQSSDSKSVYVHAVYGTKYANKTVTLNDPTYTFTFYNTHGGTPSPSAGSTSSAQYGHTYGSTPSGTREGFTFKGYFRDSDVADSFTTDNTSGKTKLESSTPYNGNYKWYAAWQANTHQLTFSYPNSATDYTFNNHGSQFYYSNQIVAPTPPSVVNVGVDYTYTFNNTWTAGTTTYNSSSMPTMPANDITFVANYTQTIHYSDLSDLNDAIAIAKTIVDAGNGANSYQVKQYTDESWATFVQVYNNAVTMKNQNSGNGPLLSAQQSVNEMAALLNSTRPIKSKLTVVFVDEDGAIIKDGFHLVDYGTTVTAPTTPTKDPDATYHYTFNSWASTDSDSLSDLNPVTHNLKFVAKFTKTAHTFTTTTASGCHGDTVTTKTCSTCGYSETTASDVTLHTWSTDYKTISPANCSTVGKEAKYCTECGAYDASSVRDIAKTSHSFSAWTNYQAATCGAQGVQTRTCANCGQLEVQKTAATGSHTYETKHTCAATCTADGYTVKVCTVCGNTTITTTTKLGHNLTTTTTQAATCASVGVKETKCSRCDYGKTEIIPATGTHSYGAWTTISTANCISKGVKTRECSVCGKVETDITNQTAHSWGAWTEVTPATCTGKGVQKRTCPTCGQSETQETAALGHNFVQSAVVPATCEAGGYTLNVCDRSGCGAQQITNKTDAKGHSWTTVAHDADCTHSAYTEYKCANDASHNYNKYDETKPALGHDFTGTEIVTKAATCTEDGTKTIACTRCSEVQTVTIPKTGHNYTAEAAVPPSCTTSGYTPYTCSACDDTYNVYDSSKPATGHSWGEWNVTTAPTETTDGEQTRTCSKCGVTETAPVPATSHTLVEDTSKTVAPTCTKDGAKVYKCTATHPGQTGACTYTVTEVVPKLGHDLSTTKTDATCTVDGKVITGCSRCDYKAETVIPATGHSYTNTVTTQPTCTESGFTILACKGCGKTIRTDFVPAYGHKYDEGVYEDATCTTPGGIRYTCTNTNPDGTPCGHSYLVKDTEPLGHTWGKWHYVEHPTVEDAYAKQRDCTRGTCTAIEYERGKMSNEDDINVYYKVEFYNPWTTDTCYELNNGRTKLAKTYKTTKVNEGYYLAGTEATYPSSVLPRRDKDYTWGAYKLIDWTYDEVGQTDSALNDMKSISKNMTVYAEFEGYDVYYKVRFWNGSDPLTIDQVILHGHSAQYPFDPPKKADNLYYKYEFTGWDYDYTAIYDSVAISAVYNQIPKSYTMVYCDWDGTELAREDFRYGEPAKNNPTNLSKTADATYIYEFSGLWQTQPGKEQYISLNSLTVPDGTKEGAEVKVYAKYYSKPKSYVVNIHGYGINNELIPGATVQIYSSNGQIVSTAKLNENSDVTVSLYYDTLYQIVIIDESGNVGSRNVELNTSLKDETTGALRPTEVTIYLEQYEDPDHGGSNCHCICHSFLGGFWISILNLIYRLTGRKIVCCYDMFATHGDKLLYGK